MLTVGHLRRILATMPEDAPVMLDDGKTVGFLADHHFRKGGKLPRLAQFRARQALVLKRRHDGMKWVKAANYSWVGPGAPAAPPPPPPPRKLITMGIPKEFQE